ncbi:hypothetical protein B0J15DRAFT_225684 [Fusarium solani]|uniref:Uncharacterized protein n=1 Tax=Fusarium solani TaxID=169388 RepID=A0A9P9L0M0_FUSSL|nr:uncharacterized protein B0J15DRAFT_225684 [Fusarium solani]KAH7271856.1 hypothetical protein B0J15DRAFT_225684 [Fusarium solani]
MMTSKPLQRSQGNVQANTWCDLQLGLFSRLNNHRTAYCFCLRHLSPSLLSAFCGIQPGLAPLAQPFRTLLETRQLACYIVWSMATVILRQCSNSVFFPGASTISTLVWINPEDDNLVQQSSMYTNSTGNFLIWLRGTPGLDDVDAWVLFPPLSSGMMMMFMWAAQGRVWV